MLRDTKTELNVRSPIKLVLDTNVVLDWLVFEDAGLDVLRNSLRSGSAAVVSSPAAYAELVRVLAYPSLGLDAAQQVDVLAVYDSHRAAAHASDPMMNPEMNREMTLEFPTKEFPPKGFPRCRDADDQHFLELAYRADALLVSRDKALLALTSKARQFGVTVLDIAAMNRTLTSALNAGTPDVPASAHSPATKGNSPIIDSK